MVSRNLHDVVRSGTMWMVEISYTWVSYLAPHCIWYPCCESSLRSGSPLYSTAMTFRKSFILLLNFMLAIFLRTPLYMSSCNCIIMSFACLIEPYVSFLTLIISHIAWAYLMSIHAETFCISFAAWFPIFTGRGLSPECHYPTHMSLHWA